MSEDECGCYACIGSKPAYEDTWLTIGMTRMIVCSECGNKRCPHSTDHRHACTGSNEPRERGMSKPHATGAKPENPYCMRCGKHLGLAFHETNEHDEARRRAVLHEQFDAIVDDWGDGE